MKKLIIAAAALAVATTATSAAAQAVSSTPRAQANARLIKPLVLTSDRGLNFGTIVMGTLTGNETVSISQAGAVTCGSSGNLVCSGSPTSARYTVTGTQGQVVVISSSAASFTLNNLTQAGSLTLVPSFPTSLTLGNSGAPGNTFTVGGSVTIGTATTDGVYQGEIDIQVAYQ